MDNKTIVAFGVVLWDLLPSCTRKDAAPRNLSVKELEATSV
jgi:hypothetical protein